MEALHYLAENRWTYLVIGFPLTIFLIVFYLRNKKSLADAFISFILWAKQSLEVNGQANTEKLVICAVLMLVYVPGRLKYIWTSFSLQQYNWESQMWGFGLDAIVIAVANGWVTPKDLIEIKNGFSSRTTTTTTETKSNIENQNFNNSN